MFYTVTNRPTVRKRSNIIWRFFSNFRPPSPIWRYSDGLSKPPHPRSVIWYLNSPLIQVTLVTL